MAAAEQERVPTGLLQLPLEMKQQVIRHVRTSACFYNSASDTEQISLRRDILHLALTCHNLELATRPLRYKDLVIQDFPIPDAKPDALYWLKCLTVRERKHGQVPQPGYISNPGKVEGLDEELSNDLSMIPRDQLKSFK